MRILTPLVMATVLALPLTGRAMADTLTPNITVTGEGIVDVAPDMATISLGVTTSGATAKEAMDANSAALKAVMEQLTAAGIAPRDMQTSNLSLGPDYSKYDSSSGGTPGAYVANNMLNIRVRDLTKVGEILDASITDGANTLNGISFGLAEPRPQMDEARKAAVADARARAQLLAEASGVALGPVIAVTDGGGYANPAPMFRQEASADAVPVAGGELSVTANVTVTFGIGQ